MQEGRHSSLEEVLMTYRAFQHFDPFFDSTRARFFSHDMGERM